MKVSILIPTLNRLEYLKGALQSCRDQSYDNVEIIVSDDGSTDGTVEWLKEMADREPKLRIAPSNPSPGLFTNMNHLVTHADGELFCLLGDDDTIERHFISSLILPLKSDPKGAAAFCDHWLMNAKGDRLRGATDTNSRVYRRASLSDGKVESPTTTVLHGSLCIGFSLFRKSVLADPYFDISCEGAADVDYAIRTASAGGIYYSSSRLGNYRFHSGTATSKRSLFMFRGVVTALEKHQFDSSQTERLRRVLLLNRYRLLLGLLSTEDRSLWEGYCTRYLRLGGSRFHPRYVLARALYQLPKKMAWEVRSTLGKRERQVCRATPEKSSTT